MADNILLITWGNPVRGREERSQEVFNEAVGILGRMQEGGRIEKFDVVLLAPNGELGGYVEVHGTPEQLSALELDDEFQRNTADAQMIVERLRHIRGVTNQGVAEQMGIYQQAIAKVPQTA